MKTRLMVLAAAAGLGLCSLAGASVTYSYVAQSTNPGGVIVPGTTNTLNLYLQEVSSGGSFTVASDGGLYSGGVALVEQAGGTGVTVTGVANNSSTEPTGFSGSNVSGILTNGGAYVEDITSNTAKVGVAAESTSTSGTATTSRYLLGSVTLDVGATPNANFLVESIHDTPANDGETHAGQNAITGTFTNDYDLDPDNGVPGGDSGANANPTPLAITSVVSSVPEPASVAVFGLAAAGLLARKRRNAAC